MKKHTREQLTKIIVLIVIFGMVFGGLGGTLFMAYANHQRQIELEALQKEQATERLAQIEAQLAAQSADASNSALPATEGAVNAALSDFSAAFSESAPAGDFNLNQIQPNQPQSELDKALSSAPKLDVNTLSDEEKSKLDSAPVINFSDLSPEDQASLQEQLGINLKANQ